MAPKAKRKLKGASPEEGATGLLTGKTKELLPAPLKLSASVAEDDDDDGPPEEASTVRITRPQSKPGKDDSDDDGPPEQVTTARGATANAEFFWQEPEKRKVLGALRDNAAKRRRKNEASNSRLEKDGVVLARLSEKSVASTVGVPAAAKTPSDFLSQELFGRRKRKRSAFDRNDRNSLGRMGSHRDVKKF
mmetsp:Transcript_62280/g.96822  ORF Transcript_62280/g.96822 Transcript_62280/m.96822 type:complete len:191 (-) Transcript_62280:37-609(-)